MKNTIFLLCVFLLLSCSGDDGPTAPPGGNDPPKPTPIPPSTIAMIGRVNFEKNHIFTVKPNGTGLRQISFEEIGESLEWSPDGKSITYLSLETFPNQLYRVDVDGENRIQLGDIDHFRSVPKWSPDGTQILLKRSEDLILINAEDGTQEAVVADGQGLSAGMRPLYFDHEWFPDGSKIIFVGDFNRFVTLPDLYTVNADGSDLQKIFDDESISPGAPQVSPDGSYIAFLGSDSRSVYGISGKIYVIDADGSNLRALDSGRNNYVPKWSPDGTKLAFFGVEIDFDNVSRRLMVYDAANNFDLFLIASVPPTEPFVEKRSWSPESEKILVPMFAPGAPFGGMGYLDIVSGNTTLIFGADFFIMRGSWSPEIK